MSQTLLAPATLDHPMPPQIDVYTDGGCDPNPGPGGWGTIIRWKDREWVLSGNDPHTTNNRMEIHAAAAALALLEGLLGRCQVNIYTDSQYLRRGITEWMDTWVSRGWHTSSEQPVKNQDLWRVLHRLTQAHDVTWHWLKGHAGHPLNERADRLATEALRSLQRVRRVPDARESPDVRESPDARQSLGAHQSVDDGRPTVDICVKASCRGAERRGGWAAVMRTGEHAKSLSGSEPSTTANAMLIRGATEALKALTKPCQVTLCSDANYLIKGASLWVKGWQARGWQTREGKPVGNRAEWEALLKAAHPHHITWLQVQEDAAPADLSWAGELAAEAASPREPES